MKTLCILLPFFGALAVRVLEVDFLNPQTWESQREKEVQGEEVVRTLKPQQKIYEAEDFVDPIKHELKKLEKGAVAVLFQYGSHIRVFWTRPLGMLLDVPFNTVQSVDSGSPAAKLGVETGQRIDWIFGPLGFVHHPNKSFLLESIGTLPQDKSTNREDVGPGAFPNTSGPGAFPQDDLSGDWYFFADWWGRSGDLYFNLKKSVWTGRTEYVFNARRMAKVWRENETSCANHLQGRLSKMGEWYEGQLERREWYEGLQCVRNLPTEDRIRVRLEDGNLMFSYNEKGKGWQPESIGLRNYDDLWRVFKAWAVKSQSKEKLVQQRGSKAEKGDCSDRALLKALAFIDVVRTVYYNEEYTKDEYRWTLTPHVSKIRQKMKSEPLGVLPIFQMFRDSEESERLQLREELVKSYDKGYGPPYRV